jgi:hypothetical protein
VLSIFDSTRRQAITSHKLARVKLRVVSILRVSGRKREREFLWVKLLGDLTRSS